MSNYINVLRRLERERRLPEPMTVPAAAPREIAVPTIATAPAVPAPAPIVVPEDALPLPTPAPRTVISLPSVMQAVLPNPAPPIAAVPPEPIELPTTQQVDTRRSRAFATEAHPGIATLLDNIRMLASGRTHRMVVFCGASKTDSVTRLASALASHATQSGLKAVVGTLSRTTTGTVLTAGPASNARPLEVNLDAGAPTVELQDWVRQIAPTSDLIVITGPPLATSIDAALFACACDGLVIVAESEVTERAALQVAADRARIAGCHTLGVVMHGTKDRLPGWIRRLVGDPSEPHLARED